ncbi:UNVERIFIED_CONTAM: hypothetical protein HDU68_008303 [Siphonaria sp. JEL0065]|nr:hypothetical protein HDU68_008303 [Siphonaria sp. JEL0065]
MAQTERHRVQALDTVLFHGRGDPISSFIQKVESHFVVPSFGPRQRFHAPWTHAAILVDKNVLPLDFLEEGKLYVFESILSGRIFHLYHYCEVVPVDHEIDPRLGFWLGPQLREWVPLLQEVEADVAVFKLDESERERLLSQDLETTRKTMLDFYETHKNFGYPMNPLPQFAAASQDLYARVKTFKGAVEEILKRLPSKALEIYSKPSEEIFCSEMVAKLYEALLVETFHESKPPKEGRFKHFTEYTPLDLEAAEILKGASEIDAIYAKLRGKLLLDLVVDKDGHEVMPVSDDLQRLAFPYKNVPKDLWQPVRNGILPSNAHPSGYTAEGKPLFISRAVVGSTLQIGYSNSDGIMKANWEGAEITLEYEHEVLSVAHHQKDFEWIPSGNMFGAVPLRAVAGGCDEDGNPIYIARARIADENSVGLGTLVIGPINTRLGGARFAVGGKEVFMNGDYEVLCRKSHFLERLWFSHGAERFQALLFAILFFVLGKFEATNLAILCFTIYFFFLS